VKEAVLLERFSGFLMYTHDGLLHDLDAMLALKEYVK